MKSEKQTTESVKVNKSSKLRCLQKCMMKQRIAMLISTFVIVLIILAVLSVLYDNGFRSNCQIPCNISRRKATDGRKSYRYCSCEGAQAVICSRAPNAEDLEIDIYNLEPCTASDLTITNSTFPAIPAFFLSEYPFAIVSLTITRNSLSEIADDAFNSDAFANLKELTFRYNDNFRYLRKDSFRGLNTLSGFSFEMTAMSQVKFEKNFLEHMRTITVLQIHRCKLTKEHFNNITSSDVYLTVLQNLDLRFNLIETLDSRVFDKLKAVALFNIVSSGIQTVESGAFHGLTSLQTLNLSDNLLKTLPKNVFGSHVTRVDLHKNYWQCDCNLLWLRDLYMNSNILREAGIPLICDNRDNMEFSEVVFCTDEESATTEINTTTNDTETTENDSSETTEKTTEIGTTTTLEEPSKRYKEIICRDWIRSPLTISGLGDLIYTQAIYTAYESFIFEFYDPDLEPVELTVVITGNITDYHLLWFNSRNISETGCVTNMADIIVLNALERNETYTFCILYKEQVTVSPYDCFGFEIRVSFPERAWIRNKHLEIFIISAVAILLFAIVVSAIITYCCIRRYPVLIKGNKRVIIVGKKKPAESTAPKEYERPVYVPPSIASILSNATPSSYGYTRIRRRHYRSPMLRSLSEHSVFSNEVSYIKPAGPSTYQLNTWRLHSKLDPEFLDAMEGNVYPPPLPPPNNIQHLSWEENLYTTL